MSPAPLDAINLVPQPVDSAPPPQSDALSFDDHLQQARQASEPAPAGDGAQPPADDGRDVPTDQNAPPADPPGDEVVAVDEPQPDDGPTKSDDQPVLSIAWAIVPVLPQLKPIELTVGLDAPAESPDLSLLSETVPEVPVAKAPEQAQRAGLVPIALPPALKDVLKPKSVDVPQQRQNVDTATASLVPQTQESEPLIDKLDVATKESALTTEHEVISGNDPSNVSIANPFSPTTAIASSSSTDIELAIAETDLAIAQAPAEREPHDESSSLPSDLPSDAAPSGPDGAAANQIEGPTQSKAPGFTIPSRHAVRTTESSGMSEADSARFVQRVARAFQVASEGDGQLRLRLSPPELGSLRLDVSVRQGVLTAHVEAETPQARMLLLDNLPALRDRLQEQNIKLERFDVDLMNQSLGGQPQGFREREQQPEDNSLNTRVRTTSDDSIGKTQPVGRQQLDGGQLNVVV